MKILAVILLMLPGICLAQTRDVDPSDLEISVHLESEGVPYVGEMVLITIRGVYRRHITRETLQQPDFDGFNWTQLGPDYWTEERERGQKVKVLKRRMALYPERSGTLEIGAFVHHLTLTDEGDDWFEHDIRSEPIKVEVAPVPASEEDGWWFPVRRLEITDGWSNPPDQLASDAGVLRIIRVEAIGATPEMIPPMPHLTSPSAMIFPHPEKRLLELSPEGPVTYAFWRWTIRPTNGTSAILEPVDLEFFDTVNRVPRTVRISPQRIAYGTREVAQSKDSAVQSAALPGLWALWLGAAVFLLGCLIGLRSWRFGGVQALSRFGIFDPLTRQARRMAIEGEVTGFRKALWQIQKRDGPSRALTELIDQLDRAVFANVPTAPDLKRSWTLYRRAARREDAARTGTG